MALDSSVLCLINRAAGRYDVLCFVLGRTALCGKTVCSVNEHTDVSLTCKVARAIFVLGSLSGTPKARLVASSQSVI